MVAEVAPLGRLALAPPWPVALASPRRQAIPLAAARARRWRVSRQRYPLTAPECFRLPFSRARLSADHDRDALRTRPLLSLRLTARPESVPVMPAQEGSSAPQARERSRDPAPGPTP